MKNDYYVSRQAQLLKDFDKTIKRMKKVFVSYLGDDLADVVLQQARQEYQALIPELPFIGGKKNQLTPSLIGSAWCLAIYRALKTHGKTVEQIGEIIYKAVQAQYDRYPGLLLRLVGRLRSTRYFIGRAKKQAAESQQRRYPGNWVFTIVEGDGKEFDYGYDYTECGICKFYSAQGAEELTPFLCQLDFPMSEAFGIELLRTMTIAEGFASCDFRFKR